MSKRQFPFFTRIGGRLVKVTGLHWSGRFYESEDAGLLPLHITPVDAPQAPPAFLQQAAIEGEATLRGCFKQKRLTPRERAQRAQSAEIWLISALYHGPVYAREIQRRIKDEGQSKWGVWRAKKRLGVISIKVWGTWQGHGAR